MIASAVSRFCSNSDITSPASLAGTRREAVGRSRDTVTYVTVFLFGSRFRVGSCRLGSPPHPASRFTSHLGVQYPSARHKVKLAGDAYGRPGRSRALALAGKRVGLGSMAADAASADEARDRVSGAH